MKALNEIDFLALAKKEKKARKRSRLLALAHFKEGQSRQQMAIGITLKSTLMSTTNRPIFIVCSISKAFHGYPADPNTLNNQKKRKNGLKKCPLR
jgi:hypothetical protein